MLFLSRFPFLCLPLSQCPLPSSHPCVQVFLSLGHRIHSHGVNDHLYSCAHAHTHPTNPLFWVPSPYNLTFHCLLNIPQAPKTHSLPQNKIWHHYSPTTQVRMAGQCLGFLPLPHTHFQPVFSHLHSPFCKTEPGVSASELFSLPPSL